ncbi:MAG: GNAT family protein [Rikenellaceae bacterium]
MDNYRVYLRGLEIDDYKAIHEIKKDTDVLYGYSKYNTYPSSENDKKWVESRIFNKDEVTCAICLKETDELVGVIFLLKIDLFNRTGESPIFLSKRYWNNGYATEARMLMLKYAFFERGLNRVTDYVIEENLGSLKMHEKCGYRKEGLLRQSMFKGGKLINQYVLGCLKEDFEKLFEER